MTRLRASWNVCVRAAILRHMSPDERSHLDDPEKIDAAVENERNHRHDPPPPGAAGEGHSMMRRFTFLSCRA